MEPADYFDFISHFIDFYANYTANPLSNEHVCSQVFCSLERGFHKSSLHPEFNIIAIDSLTELNIFDALRKY